MPARRETTELNARETEILRFAAKGLSDRAIASKLGLSAETVRWYNKRVYEKLDAANRTDAVSRATELGLLGPASEPVVRHPIRYVDNDGVSLAYQVIGKGGSDVLFIPGFVSHIEVSWETPDYVNFFEQLGRLARVITFDKRGVGLSDRVQGGPSLDQTVRDALCVLDATGSRRAFVFGTSEGGAAALLLASMFPDRVGGLILFGATPKVVRSGNEPVWSSPREAFDQRLAALLATWGEPWAIERFAPSRMHDKAFQAWWPRCLRAAASPSAVKAVIENAAAVDIRGLLSEVATRTLVMGRTGDRADGVSQAKVEVAKSVEICHVTGPSRSPPMTRPLVPADLPEEAASFAEKQIAAGRFADVDAFITAGMNALKERDEAKLMALRSAIDEGEASGVAEGDSFARVRAQLGIVRR